MFSKKTKEKDLPLYKIEVVRESVDGVLSPTKYVLMKKIGDTYHKNSTVNEEEIVALFDALIKICDSSLNFGQVTIKHKISGTRNTVTQESRLD